MCIFGSGLKDINLNEGLKSFEAEAFSYTQIKELYIPSSVERMNYDSITANIKNLDFLQYPKTCYHLFQFQCSLLNIIHWKRLVSLWNVTKTSVYAKEYCLRHILFS